MKFELSFTNKDFAAASVWRNYLIHGNAENRIKELKADFGADSFN
ncbi:MAG TPA: hypothetical protein PLQ78_04965 [Flavipsychrobacter sp.]|jgi:hypothetical protein|nr:hypothetical protein [Flavipsychrobacter sp.]